MALSTSADGDHFRKQHGMKLGDRLDAVSLPCADGVRRIVGTGRQLITFARPDDYCESCYHHLLGVSALWRSVSKEDELLLVVYAPPSRRIAAEREYRTVTGAPLCFDEEGILWNRHRLVTTPFTVLVLDGKIVYASDVPLDDSAQKATFLRDVIRVRSR
jgi:hypothetical protein